MKYGIIIGSHRKESQSSKVGRFIEQKISELNQNNQTYILDLRLNPLPLWEEGMWETDSKIKQQWQPYSAELASCDTFVIISPEWSGMAPSGLKNFFLYCKRELEHKPAMLVGVSSTRGGAYPIAELRMSSYKNTYICYIPNHIIIRDVEHVLNTPTPDENNKSDVYIQGRIIHSLKVLEQYARALRSVRESEVEDRTAYAHGM